MEVNAMEGGEHPRSQNTAIHKGVSDIRGCLFFS